MATWTQATLLTRKGDEHLVPAIGAADAGEAEMQQVVAAEQSAGHVADDGAPGAVTPCVALGIGSLEFRQVALDGSIER